MINLNKAEVIDRVLVNLESYYEREYSELKQVGYTHVTEGLIRDAAGDLVEKLLQNIFDTINNFLGCDKIVSKVGSTDFLKKTIEYKGKVYVNDKIQVDRHVWYKNKRIAFIENKTYLDTCYYDRALADFKKIAQALYQEGKNPSAYAYIVFAGQDAGKENTFLTYKAEFYNETKWLFKDCNGIEPQTFFFLKGKRRSVNPWYKTKFELNHQVISDFVELILSLLD